MENIQNNINNEAPLRMGVYIDLHNTEKGSERYNTNGLRLNYRTLIEQLTEGYEISVLKAYDSTQSEEIDDRRLAEIHDSLDSNGFELVLKRPQLIDETGKRRVVQKEVDTSIVADILMDAMDHVFDTCMIVSGDRDFCPVVEKLKTRGIPVKAASFEMSLSECMRNSCECTVIEDLMALEATTKEGLLGNIAREVPVCGGETCE